LTMCDHVFSYVLTMFSYMLTMFVRMFSYTAQSENKAVLGATTTWLNQMVCGARVAHRDENKR
jgi:hypothetical protein